MHVNETIRNGFEQNERGFWGFLFFY